MGQTSAVTWVRVTEHTAWKPRDSCGEVEYKGRMWLLGGWFNSNSIGPRDVWSSPNGVDWEMATLTAGWRHGDLPTTVVYDDKMWFMGGWYAGRLPEASASNEVWYSTDGANWQCATTNAAWRPRLGAGGVVHDGKMWILGGVERYFDGEEKHLLNDVWYSTNGKDWTQATAQAPWAPRSCHGALSFKGKIWVFGGGNYLPKYAGHNDVWSSPDGVHWTQVTAHAPWHPRIWFSPVVYRDRMWLMGGWSNNPSKNWNDVWYSADGADWKELRTETIWSPRHETSAYVLANKMWLVGGNAWPLVNDVWSIEIPESFLK
jgi:N-acetylneuraminic acid mutarotase